jgi:hypothetical protein
MANASEETLARITKKGIRASDFQFVDHNTYVRDKFIAVEINKLYAWVKSGDMPYKHFKRWCQLVGLI